MTLNIKTQYPESVQPLVEELEETLQVQTYNGNPAWAQAKLHWFTMNLRDEAAETYTLKKLCEDLNLSYGTLRQIAATEKWTSELDQMRIKRTELMMSRVMDMQVLSELDIRLRQAHVGRVAQAVALKHIQGIDPSKMKTSDAIMLLSIGLEQERKALGMATTPAETPQTKTDKDQKANKTSVMQDAMKLIDNIKAKQELKDVN